MEFESLDGSIRAVRFFNINNRSPRGNNYPAKQGGQFIPPEHGKFRRFWLNAVGEAPKRWCRVHKSMRSKLSGLIFICEYKEAFDGKGNAYWKIIKINKEHKICT